MKKRILVSTCALLFVFNALLGVVAYRALAENDGKEKADAAYSSMAVFARAMQLVRQDFVDETKVDYEELTHAALRGMLASLDPHSQFMEPKDFKGMQDDTNSRFGGLGISVSTPDGSLVVVSTIEGSPGFRAGILPGDQIIKIDGQPTDKFDLNDSTNLLRGEAGSKVTLTILRPATKEIKDFPITRENIKVASVKEARLLPHEQTGDHKIGYARITQFNSPTAGELAAKLDELEGQGMQAFVLDLRYNPGGLLQSAVEVAGQFLPPKKVVVTTEGRSPSQTKSYAVPPGIRQRPNYPLALLINNGSASGSEIVAGALKDADRAILVGETTFGKGSVQSVVQLQDGSALRLTTAKYFSPKHFVIHERGVAPTIRATMTAEQERLLMMQRREGEHGENERKELAGFHDTQLDRAVDALKGVLIYDKKKDGSRKAAPKE